VPSAAEAFKAHHTSAFSSADNTANRGSIAASEAVLEAPELGLSASDVAVAGRRTVHGFFIQLRSLLWREALMTARNPGDAAGRIAACFGVGLVTVSRGS